MVESGSTAGAGGGGPATRLDPRATLPLRDLLLAVVAVASSSSSGCTVLLNPGTRFGKCLLCRCRAESRAAFLSEKLSCVNRLRFGQGTGAELVSTCQRNEAQEGCAGGPAVHHPAPYSFVGLRAQGLLATTHYVRSRAPGFKIHVSSWSQGA